VSNKAVVNIMCFYNNYEEVPKGNNSKNEAMLLTQLTAAWKEKRTEKIHLLKM